MRRAVSVAVLCASLLGVVAVAVTPVPADALFDAQFRIAKQPGGAKAKLEVTANLEAGEGKTFYFKVLNGSDVAREFSMRGTVHSHLKKFRLKIKATGDAAACEETGVTDDTAEQNAVDVKVNLPECPP